MSAWFAAICPSSPPDRLREDGRTVQPVAVAAGPG